MPLNRELHGGLTHGIGLVDIDLRGNVSGCTLQIVGNCPVIFVTVCFANHVRDHRTNATQLCMTESILGAGIGEEGAVRMRRSLGYDDDAIAATIDAFFDALEKRGAFKRNFGKQNDMRRFVATLACETTCRGDPTSVSTHHFHDEYFGRSFGHRRDVERRLEGRDGNVFGDRAESWAAIGVRQIIIDRLRYADAGDRVSQGLAHLGDLVGGIHRVVTAVVKEIADVVSLEDLDQPLVFGAVLLEPLELETR